MKKRGLFKPLEEIKNEKYTLILKKNDIFGKLKIIYMSIVINDTSLERYLRFLTRLDNVTKKKLIVRLTESIDFKENKGFNLATLNGAWKDSRSSDEIISEIKKSRVEKNHSIEF